MTTPYLLLLLVALASPARRAVAGLLLFPIQFAALVALVTLHMTLRRCLANTDGRHGWPKVLVAAAFVDVWLCGWVMAFLMSDAGFQRVSLFAIALSGVVFCGWALAVLDGWAKAWPVLRSRHLL